MGQVNGQFCTCPMKIYLSHRTDNAQRTKLSPYIADNMHNLLKKNSIKPDINSIENSVDPDPGFQLD